MKVEEFDPVVVFSGTLLEADMVKSLLENEGIPAYLKDEYMGTMVPWNVAPGGAGAVKVVVAQRDETNALSIVEEYRHNVSDGGESN
jgi:Rad3-related DNA helicase